MRRSKAPVGTSRRGGLALLRRLIVFRQAPACRAIRTPEPVRPRMRHSAERRALGLRLCGRHAPRYDVSAPRRGNARGSAGPVTLLSRSGNYEGNLETLGVPGVESRRALPRAAFM